MNIEATMDNATTSTKPWKKYAPKNGRLTVRNAVEKFMISRMNCTAKTRENYWASLNLLVRFMEKNDTFFLDEIDGDLLEYYFDVLKTPLEERERSNKELNYRDWMEEKDRCKKYKQNTYHSLIF